MARADFHLVNETDEFEQQFRLVMRRLAGGVSIITAGHGNDITGMTVTSLTSLSVGSPPVFSVCSLNTTRIARPFSNLAIA